MFIYFFNLAFILIMKILVYILIELPFKNISKYLIIRDKYTLNLEEDEDDEENNEKNNEQNNANEEEKENLKN